LERAQAAILVLVLRPRNPEDDGGRAGTRAHTPFGKSYSVAGFSTRIRWRIFSSGTQSLSRSNSTASSGTCPLACSLGCGQSLPHTHRSGAAFAYARATALESA